MKSWIFGLAVLCTSLCAFSLFGQDTMIDKNTQETFPLEVSFEAGGKQYQLEGTGVATRKKLIIKVYSIAHYLQKGAAKFPVDKAQAIMSDDNAKQLTMKWVRDVPVDKVKDAYQDSFHKVFPGDAYAKLGAEIDAFTKFFAQGAKKGDEYVLRWIPGGTIEVSINGQIVGSVTNKDFAKGLWSIWFGPNSIVDRNALMSR
jgi:hypothetical protein